MERRQKILNAVETLVVDFLYYDRRGDEELVEEDIEEAIDAEEIGVEEIVERFSYLLRANLGLIENEGGSGP